MTTEDKHLKIIAQKGTHKNQFFANELSLSDAVLQNNLHILQFTCFSFASATLMSQLIVWHYLPFDKGLE